MSLGLVNVRFFFASLAENNVCFSKIQNRKTRFRITVLLNYCFVKFETFNHIPQIWKLNYVSKKTKKNDLKNINPKINFLYIATSYTDNIVQYISTP